MIDYDYLKGLLFPVDEHDESKKINPEDFISDELISIFRKAKSVNIKRCFCKSNYQPEIGYPKYTVEVHCETCGKNEVMLMTKTDLFEYIARNKISVCNICREKEQEQRRIKTDKFNAEKRERTQEYIKKYLTPGMDFIEKNHKNITALFKVGIDMKEIEQHIRDMDYYDFLDTPYWKAISRSIKHKAGYKCALCGKNDKLRTHHRDYAHHGSELYYQNDLICLCADCHEKFHDKRSD